MSLETGRAGREQVDVHIAYTRRRFLKCMVSQGELRELVTLENLCFPEADAYDPETMRMFTSLNGAVLVRYYRSFKPDAEQLVGFLLADCLDGSLITLDIHPDFRRMGIGSRLMRMGLNKLRDLGHRKVVSHVETTNLPSLALHESFGFYRTGTRKHYYGNGRDAAVLKIRLDSPPGAKPL